MASRFKKSFYKQLSLEALEQREVPALFTWVAPTDGSWNTGSNWSSGGVTGVIPTGVDDVLFDPNYSTKTCSVGNGLGAIGVLANSLTMNTGAGVLNLSQTDGPTNIGVGGIIQSGGDIEQSSGQPIKDQGDYDFNGGTLNTSSTLVADLEVADGKTVTVEKATSTGSDIKLTGNAILTVLANVTFKNNAGISISANSHLYWLEGAIENDTESKGILSNLGEVEVKIAGGLSVASNMPIQNAGNYKITTGKVILFGEDTNGDSYSQTTGTTDLANGTKITCLGGGGFTQTGGNFYTRGNAALETTNGNVNGTVRFLGGLINLAHDNQTTTGKLTLIGDLVISGVTEWDVKIDVANNVSDRINITGNVQIGTYWSNYTTIKSVPIGNIPANKTYDFLTVNGANNTLIGSFNTLLLGPGLSALVDATHTKYQIKS